MPTILLLLTVFFSPSVFAKGDPMGDAKRFFQTELNRDGSIISNLSKVLEHDGFNFADVRKGHYDGNLSLPSAILSHGRCRSDLKDQDFEFLDCPYIYTVSAAVTREESNGWSDASIRAEVESDYQGHTRILSAEIRRVDPKASATTTQ
jgi:hypothetical protein